jgi:putative ABC transport system permease protein
MGFRRLTSLLRNLLHGERKERELDEEVRAHELLLADEKIRAGMNSEEAHRQARLELGGLEQLKEQVREVRAGHVLGTFLQDVRFGLRMLRRSPGFATTAVLTLVLGIGANTAIFSVVNGVLLRSLPFQDAQRLVMVWNRGAAAAGGDRTPLAVADLLDWRAQNRSFIEIAAFETTSYNLTGGDLPEQIRAAQVTSNFFSVLGVQPRLGRTFFPDEDRAGAPCVALLSDGLWRRRFAADPKVAGNTLNLDGRPCTIIGVAPAHLDFPDKAIALWTTVRLEPPKRRGPYFLSGVARLKKDVSLQAARAETNSIRTSFPSAQHRNGQFFNFNVLPLTEFIVGDVRLSLLVLLAAVTLVLLIAAGNVTNLMLVRSTARVKEISLRTALGASRARIIRQLLTESMLLALTGGVGGLVLAAVGVRLLLRLAPDTIPRLSEIGTDWRVLSWTALVSVLAGMAFGLAPAWQGAKLNLDEALKEGGRATSESAPKRRWRSALVVMELALAVMLLIGATLLIKSFWRLQRVDSGVSTARMLTMEIPLRGPRYEKAQQLEAFFPRLLERIQALPGVRSAAVSNSLPPDTSDYSDNFEIEGHLVEAAQPPPIAYMILVSPDYFRTFGIPLRSGRYFSAADAGTAQRVSIISETTARQFFPNEDPIGKRITEKGQIVGVVGDVKYTGLADAMQPAIYEPLSQAPSWDVFVSVKTDVADPLSLAAAVRGELKLLDAALPVSQVGTLDDRFAAATAQPRFRTALIALFAVLALVLAVIGTYGVLCHLVARRTHEIGIRVALGAQPDEVVKLVLKQGAGLAVAGALIGLVGSFALTGILRNLLFGVSATDWPTFCGVSGLLIGTALAACYLPARRAMRVDPVVALRYE